MSSAPPQMCIDGQWIPCLPAEGYGALGVRYLCDLGSSSGEPAKRLLVRHQVWRQGRGANRAMGIQLTAGKVPESKSLGLRPVMSNKYQQASAQANGSPLLEMCPVLQQDVTGLISLKQAILRAIISKKPQQIWKLFYQACKALDAYGQSVGVGRPVPLQCPDGLAVDAKNRVVPLDAEILLAGPVPADSEASRAYRAWFGEGSNGLADPQDASVMHAKALVLYFRRLLGSWQQQNAGTNRELPAKIMAPLERIPSDASLDDFQDWIRQSAGEWDIVIEDEEANPAGGAPSGGSPSSPRKKRSLLLRLSLCLNLLLLIALILMLLWPRGSQAIAPSQTIPERERELADTALFFSSYCVIFPTQGTISEKVGAALQELFPDQFQEMKRHAPDHEKLLQEKKTEAIRSIRQTDKLKQLLASLAADHSIRFKGFNAAEPEEGLNAAIERGGIFTMSGVSREQHGSLLQTNGMEKILDQAGMRDQQEARELLRSFKKAIADYASLKDALSIIGDRPAYLLRLEPTAAAHDRVRRKLLSRLDKPVFISRPIPEFFDAVDPSADTGGGVASYSLRLDRKCFWRQASKDDRRNVDVANNRSNDRMKWRSFDAGQPITWKPIPLTRLTGRTDAVATFDIGVVLSNKVAVFRNQGLMVGDTHNQVLDQGKTYISRALKLEIKSIEDAISVRQQEGQFTGTLIYSYLAEQVSADNTGGDFELLTAEQFEAIRMQEDNALSP